MNKLYILIAVVLSAVVALVLFVPFSQTVQKEQDPLQNFEKEVYTLTMAHNMPKESVMHQAAERYAAKVLEKTAGKVQIKIYPNQELGNDYRMVELTRLGEIDLLLTPSAKMSVSEPSIQFIDLPFYFPSRQALYEILDGDIGNMLLAKLSNIGLLGVTFWENGFKHFTAQTPLRTVEDFEGKNMRVMKSRIIMDQFKSLGATPLAIDFHETTKALKAGVVEGQENPLTAIVGMGIHEVQNYLTLSEHAYMGYIFSISSKTYKKLPSELGHILMETALEVTPWQREKTKANEEKLLSLVQKNGVKVENLDLDQRKRFTRVMAHIPKKYEELIGPEVLAKTEEYLYNNYKKSDEYYLLGVDVDLSMDAKAAGLAIKRGVELAVDEINKEGGILGKELLVITKDHAALASKGIKNIEEFLEHKNLLGIVGGLHSAVIFEEMEYMQKSGVALFIPWATGADITSKDNKSVFRISANDMYASNFIALNAAKRLRKPAIFYENSVWGRDNYTNMQALLAKKGIEFACAKMFNRGESEFSQEIQEILKKDADGVIMIANSLEAGAIVDAMAEEKRTVPIISHWGITGGDFYKAHKKAIDRLDLTFFQTFSFEKNKNRISKRVATNYIKTYGKRDQRDILAASGTAQAYDLVKIFAIALQQAQSDKHELWIRELENISFYEGAVKNYSYPFRINRHDALSVDDYHMARYTKDGSIVEVRSEAY